MRSECQEGLLQVGTDTHKKASESILTTARLGAAREEHLSVLQHEQWPAPGDTLGSSAQVGPAISGCLDFTCNWISSTQKHYSLPPKKSQPKKGKYHTSSLVTLWILILISVQKFRTTSGVLGQNLCFQMSENTISCKERKSWLQARPFQCSCSLCGNNSEERRSMQAGFAATNGRASSLPHS